MRIQQLTILLSAVAAALLCGCAKEHTESEADAAKREFDAWLAKNYPNATRTGRGVYIVSDTPGTGAAFNTDYDVFAVVDYVWKDLQGNVTATSEADLAKQIGTYKPANFYGSSTWAIFPTETYAGIYDGIKDMRVGGARVFITPSWLNTNADYSSEEKYLKKYDPDDCTPSSIITVTLLEKIEDIEKYQIDSIDRYNIRTFGHKLDSARIGYYYLQTQKPTDDLSLKDSTVYINYTGRLLNGQVFDTTIEDTAKLYNVYEPSRDYEPIKVSMGESVDKLKLGDSESNSGVATSNMTSEGVIRGFAYTVFNMKHYEKGTCIFISSYGYAAKGSGSTIPAYAPLRFDIELVDKP